MVWFDSSTNEYGPSACPANVDWTLLAEVEKRRQLLTPHVSAGLARQQIRQSPSGDDTPSSSSGNFRMNGMIPPESRK